MLFGWGSSGGYDHAVTMVTPVATVVFPKQNSTIDPGWTDARLVCMRPSEIAAGSRVPDGVPAEEGSGVRTITGGVALNVAVALASGFMAMLYFWRPLAIWLKTAVYSSYIFLLYTVHILPGSRSAETFEHQINARV